MAANVFDTIITKGVRAGQVPARTDDAREWYRNAAKQIKRVNENTLMKTDTDRLTNKILPGNMYIFQYDAKHKDTLPFWDRVPLIFPFRKVKGGFYGINLHYLPLNLRAKLMDGLYDYTTNSRYDETTRINLSYRLLNGVAKLRYFKPCIKMYLDEHVTTRFMYIYPSEWDIAIFLPIARFEKRTANYVHAQSRNIINA
jgi:hypothetical protein